MHRVVLEIVTYFVIFMVNFRYVVCDVTNMPSLPVTIIITLLLLLTVNFRAVPRALMLISIVLGFSLMKNSSALAIIDFFLLGFLLRRIPNLNRVMAANLLIMLGFVSGLFFLNQIGIISEVTWQKNGTIAHTLGFHNPNTCALYLYAIIVGLYYFSPNGTYGVIYKIVLVILSWMTYEYTLSRTCILGLVFMIICDVIFRIRVFGTKFIIYSIPLFLMSLSFYFFVNYADFGVLDVLLSGRLSYIGRGLADIGVIDWIAGFQWREDIPVDSAYATMLSACGFLGIAIHYFYYIKYVGNVQYSMANTAMIVSILLAGLTEYVFVGLNMVSIILLILILKRRGNLFYHPSRL